MLFGYIFAICATAIWSGNFIIARGLTENISPISLAFCRWSVAVAVFVPFALKSLLAERKVLKKHLPYLCLTAFLGVTIFNTLIYFAGHTTSAINLSLIAITFPVFIIILSRIFFKELITINKGIGVLLVAFGIILLVTRGNIAKLLEISFAIGDLWMLLGAMTFALYSILIKRKPEQLSIWAFQSCIFILGLAFLFPFFIWDNFRQTTIIFDAKTFLSILYLGIFASLTAFFLWIKAIMNIGPTKAGMIYYTLPIFSGFLAYLLLGEAVTLIHFYSAVLIVSGIVTANYYSKRQIAS
jgi:drug/metabolite transporter (DMT)-like permease